MRRRFARVLCDRNSFSSKTYVGSGTSMGGAQGPGVPGPHLILGQKRRNDRREKASMVNKLKPGPQLSSRSGFATGRIQNMSNIRCLELLNRPLQMSFDIAGVFLSLSCRNLLSK